MYFVISPVFYYITHQKDIEDYIIIESNGENPNLMTYRKLKGYVESYINSNSHGVDENVKDKYIMCICDMLTRC